MKILCRQNTKTKTKITAGTMSSEIYNKSECAQEVEWLLEQKTKIAFTIDPESIVYFPVTDWVKPIKWFRMNLEYRGSATAILMKYMNDDTPMLQSIVKYESDNLYKNPYSYIEIRVSKDIATYENGLDISYQQAPDDFDWEEFNREVTIVADRITQAVYALHSEIVEILDRYSEDSQDEYDEDFYE